MRIKNHSSLYSAGFIPQIFSIFPSSFRINGRDHKILFSFLNDCIEKDTMVHLHNAWPMLIRRHLVYIRKSTYLYQLIKKHMYYSSGIGFHFVRPDKR